MNWANSTRRDEHHLTFRIWCGLYQKFTANSQVPWYFIRSLGLFWLTSFCYQHNGTGTLSFTINYWSTGDVDGTDVTTGALKCLDNHNVYFKAFFGWRNFRMLCFRSGQWNFAISSQLSQRHVITLCQDDHKTFWYRGTILEIITVILNERHRIFNHLDSFSISCSP